VRRAKIGMLIAAGAVLLTLPAATVYYDYSGGSACVRCHEIQPSYDQWHVSTHRNIACTECPGGPSRRDNLRRVAAHFSGRVSGHIHLTQANLYPVAERCKKCHQQEYADWHAGPHGSSYARFFLDRQHNTRRLLMDDCLRCHGMHFEGAMRDLVTPLNTTGPWTLKPAGLAGRAAIPCLACHQMHREGKPLLRGTPRVPPPGPTQEIFRPSLALYDRREQSSISTKILPLPRMLQGERVVKMSPDRRQALCYQCHAPLASMQAGSGDDRTGLGVHEGLSCLACHLKHGQQTRASCASCHPRLSNCGLDVETMDTTFKDPKSAHNIHFVACADCHPKGVPKKRAARIR
jgi:hypothetical protein